MSAKCDCGNPHCNGYGESWADYPELVAEEKRLEREDRFNERYLDFYRRNDDPSALRRAFG